MTLLILTTIVLLILGFFNPQASLFWYPRKRTTMASSVIYGGLLLFFIYPIAPTQQENLLETDVNAHPALDTQETKVDSQTTVPIVAVEDPAKIAEDRILRKLKARAAHDWPNDYTTQEYWINQELEDYKYMRTISDGPIKRQAERDWPYDYITQKYWYDEQVAARGRLSR